MGVVRTASAISFNFLLIGTGIFFAMNREIPCLMTYCTTSTLDCVMDEDCRNNAMCIGECGANMSCTYQCLASYENDVFKNWVQCGISDQKCIIPEIDPDQPQCNIPSVDRLNKEFELNKLIGKWYIVYGLNPIYDCFNGQWSQYSVKNSDTLYLTEYYDVIAMNGSVRTMKVEEDLGYANESLSKSILYLKSNEPGVFRDDEFMILNADPTWSRYILVYYCGICSNIRYEGAIVYSRDPVLNAKDEAALSTDMAKHGWTLDQFCPVLHPEA